MKPRNQGKMNIKKKTKSVQDKPMISEKSFAEQIGYFTIVLEDIRYQVKGVIEEQVAMRAEFNEKLDQQKQELKAEIQVTQQAVRSNGQEIKELKTEISRIDQKLTKVEGKVDRVIEVVEKHDEDVVFLKTALLKEQ